MSWESKNISTTKDVGSTRRNLRSRNPWFSSLLILKMVLRGGNLGFRFRKTYFRNISRVISSENTSPFSNAATLRLRKPREIRTNWGKNSDTSLIWEDSWKISAGFSTISREYLTNSKWPKPGLKIKYSSIIGWIRWAVIPWVMRAVTMMIFLLKEEMNHHTGYRKWPIFL